MLTEFDKYWLAGYLEGEGSFLKGSPSSPNSPAISVCSTDEDVIKHVAYIFGVKYFKCSSKTRKQYYKPVWTVHKKGRKAVCIMELIFPYMSIRRQQQIKNAINSYKCKQKKLFPEEKAKIKELAMTNMNQKEIATMFGISREWVNKIKNGRK
jgi:hypothetical protein